MIFYNSIDCLDCFFQRSAAFCTGSCWASRFSCRYTFCPFSSPLCFCYKFFGLISCGNSAKKNCIRTSDPLIRESKDLQFLKSLKNMRKGGFIFLMFSEVILPTWSSTMRKNGRSYFQNDTYFQRDFCLFFFFLVILLSGFWGWRWQSIEDFIIKKKKKPTTQQLQSMLICPV